jgi:hypothetical protein
VAAIETFLAFVNEVALTDLELHQMDIKTAFLHGRFEEEVWMEQPPGYEAGGAQVKGKLLKSLYGLRQAPKAWSDRLHVKLEKTGFTVAKADGSLFIYEAADGTKMWVLLCSQRETQEKARQPKIKPGAIARTLGL